jgi:hypothetical protein
MLKHHDKGVNGELEFIVPRINNPLISSALEGSGLPVAERYFSICTAAEAGLAGTVRPL